MSTTDAFKDVIKHDRQDGALPVEEFLAGLDRFIDVHNPYRQNRVIPAIGNGTASMEVVKRYAKELYYLGLWMTPEFPILIANAPDTDAHSLEASEHYAHWTQNFSFMHMMTTHPSRVWKLRLGTRLWCAPPGSRRGRQSRLSVQTAR